jgi:hypothetical protein
MVTAAPGSFCNKYAKFPLLFSVFSIESWIYLESSILFADLLFWSRAMDGVHGGSSHLFTSDPAIHLDTFRLIYVLVIVSQQCATCPDIAMV